MSGLFGMINCGGAMDTKRLLSCCRLGATSIQHRGPGWTGISYTNGDRVWADEKAQEKVEDFMKVELLDKIHDDAPKAINVLVQQPLIDIKRKIDAQPHYVRSVHGSWALSMDGAIPGIDELREQLKAEKVTFYSKATAEFLLLSILHLYKSGPMDLVSAMTEVIRRTVGVFSTCLMTGKSVFLFRDRFAGQPFWLAKFGQVYVWASETCAIDQMHWVLGEPEIFRVIKPGEIIQIDPSGNFQSIQAVEPASPLRMCIFNPVYTARPDSLVENFEINDWDSRSALIREGKVETIATYRRRAAQLSLEQKGVPEGFVILSVPASGDAYQNGLSEFSGLPMYHGIVRNPYVGRTFLGAWQEQRTEMALLKFNPLADLFVNHPKVVVGDDSIVRGTNFKKVCWMLRQCGVQEIHLRIGSPPYQGTCCYGGDTRTPEELFAHQYQSGTNPLDIERMTRDIGADHLEYLTLENLRRCVSKVSDPCNWCTACFDCQKWHEQIK